MGDKGIIEKRGYWARCALPIISDHQQSRGYEDGPWKGPGPPLLVAADLIIVQGDLRGRRMDNFYLVQCLLMSPVNIFHHPFNGV